MAQRHTAPRVIVKRIPVLLVPDTLTQVRVHRLSGLAPTSAAITATAAA